jgi:hypothetical protein
MRRISCIFIFLIALGCGAPHKQDIVTEIPDSVMIKIISEAHLADAGIYSGAIRQLKFSENRRRILAEILKHHQVSDSSFYRTIRVLNQHPEHFHSLYQEVITRLSQNQEKSKSS